MRWKRIKNLLDTTAVLWIMLAGCIVSIVLILLVLLLSYAVPIAVLTLLVWFLRNHW